MDPAQTDAGSVGALADLVSQIIIVAGRRTTSRSRLRQVTSSLERYEPYVLLNTSSKRSAKTASHMLRKPLVLPFG
jgi:thiazole synthase ThiGH ThiG subunit